ncbi:hypothetical protein HY251_19875 [bacterium]|nr:hypothetical protein [bacterium]
MAKKPSPRKAAHPKGSAEKKPVGPKLPLPARKLKKLLEAILAHGHESWLPKAYPKAAVEKLISDNAALVSSRRATEQDLHGTTGDRSADERAAGRLATRGVHAVNSEFPEGTAGRSDFFPSREGHEGKAPSLADRLDALAAGFAKHGISGLAADLAPAALEEMADELRGLSAKTETLVTDRKDETLGRGSLLQRTRDARKRIASKVRSHFEADDPKLALFGLKPRKTRAHRGKPRKAKGSSTGGSGSATS